MAAYQTRAKTSGGCPGGGNMAAYQTPLGTPVPHAKESDASQEVLLVTAELVSLLYSLVCVLFHCVQFASYSFGVLFRSGSPTGGSYPLQ